MADRELVKDIQNAARDCLDRSRPYFTRFLSESELAQIKAVGIPKGLTALLCAGAGNADPLRCCLGLFPSYYFDGSAISDASYAVVSDENTAELFPIKAVTFTFRKEDSVTHRDVLGSLMALGIERDTVGDIFVADGKAAVFVYEKVAPLISDSITKIGRVGVQVQTGTVAGFTLPARKYEELRFSVASMRLDNIVRCVAGTSRTGAVEKYITPQLVTLNGTVCTDVSKQLSEGDVFSVRGKGKFVLQCIGETGRKGNIHITVKNIFRVHLGGLSREC